MKYKRIMFVVFSFFVISTTFSQNNVTKDDLTNLRLQLTDSLSNVKKELIRTKQASFIQKESLTIKLEESSNTISYLNSAISTFSGFITFLGILIAIIALIVPIATYQYAVKPSREVLKDLEKSFDDRLEKYLWENRNNQINKAIENIKKGNAEEKSQAISYLTFTQSEGLTDNQLFQIYNILKRNQSDYSIKSQLSFILSTRKTDYATEFYNDSKINDDPIIRQMAMIYFAKTGFQSNYDGITHIIGNTENQDLNFTTFMANLNQYNSIDINELFNDKKIIDLLTIPTLHKMKKTLPAIILSLNTETNYKDSYLAEKIKTNA